MLETCCRRLGQWGNCVVNAKIVILVVHRNAVHSPAGTVQERLSPERPGAIRQNEQLCKAVSHELQHQRRHVLVEQIGQYEAWSHNPSHMLSLTLFQLHSTGT